MRKKLLALSFLLGLTWLSAEARPFSAIQASPLCTQVCAQCVHNGGTCFPLQGCYCVARPIG